MKIESKKLEGGDFKKTIIYILTTDSLTESITETQNS